jgi:multidrug efflux pump subunit AcrB
LQLVASGRDGAACQPLRSRADQPGQAHPLLANVVSTAELDRPELRVVPITDVAAELGISTDAISEAVRIATIGDIGANLAKFDVGDRQVPIRVQLEERARGERQMLESLKVATAPAPAVPLSAVARFEFGQGPTAIDRYDRMRRVVIGADLVGRRRSATAVERCWPSRRPRTCPPASRSSSSATPRSWKRCSRASPRRWAPAS